MAKWHADIERLDFGRRATLHVAHERSDGSLAVFFAEPVVIKDVPANEIGPLDAGFHLYGDQMTGFLQAVMDAAWAQGIRPTQPQMDTVNATLQHHLDDMRAIAFHVTGAPKP